jgi:membrane-anchored glycerophosphoryl diester phosphodiesterase (GDPDase)
MSNNSPQETSTQSIVVIIWLYFGLVLWDLFTFDLPISPAGDVVYEICGLILGLLPLIIFLFSRIDGKIKKDWQSAFPNYPLWIKGFFIILCAIILINTFALSLRLINPTVSPSNTGSLIINLIILFLKWSGFIIFILARWPSLQNATLKTDANGGRERNKNLIIILKILLGGIITYLFWRDIYNLVAIWY